MMTKHKDDFQEAIIGKRPTLTLGVKKKSESDVQVHDKDSKLILGLRRKEGLSPTELTEKTLVSPSFPLKKRHEFKPTPRKTESALLSKKIEPKEQYVAVKMPRTKGRLEVNIKIDKLPNWVETIKNDWQQLYINAEGQIVRIKIRPRTWKRLLTANENYEEWVASITGKMGQRIKDGFELIEPAIQIYEKQVDN